MLQHLSTRQKVALAIAVPASMVLIYLLFKRREDDDIPRPSTNPVAGQRHSTMLNIPHDRVGALIGREGCNIKKIQAESGAHLKFQDETQREDKSDRHLRIHGNRESVLLAERIVLEFLAEQPEIISKVLLLPQEAVGRVIGRQGSNIRQIQMSTKARVKIDRVAEADRLTMRECTITGTLQQVDLAEYKIREEVRVMEEYKQRLADAASKRQQRPTGKSAKHALHTEPHLEVQVAAEPEQLWSSGDAPALVTMETRREEPQREEPGGKDFFMVFMSAVEHPGHFWLQMISSKARQLDLMREDMTDFYNQLDNQQAFKPDNIQPGEVLAAPFIHDQSWYRARVLGFLDNDMLDMYYVDYGDSESVAKSSVCSLRDDFLSLPFQAVEFSLANVSPVGEDWTEEAIECFEQLTSVAQWKPLTAKIVDYQTTPEGTIPCVDLYDINGDREINIAKELKHRGYAKFSHEKESSGGTSASSNVMLPANDGDQDTGNNENNL